MKPASRIPVDCLLHSTDVAQGSATAGRNRGADSEVQGPRGVLLLVVLSMLSLFLLLGVAYLLAASHARQAARAYARLTFGSEDARIPSAALLDSVLMKAVRGPVVIGSGTFESLLADKYGSPTTSGMLTGLARLGSAPILTGTLANLTAGSTRPTDLVGRVLTMSQAGRSVTSHRILRALNSGSTNQPSTSFSLTLDIPIDIRPLRLATGTVPVIINGREYAGVPSSAPPSGLPSNEGWDGFDAHNLFLAQLESSTSSISRAQVARGSFLPTAADNTFTIAGTQYTLSPSATSDTVFLVTGTTDFDNDLIMDAADNDGDGVIDGIFQDYGLPDLTDAGGNTIQLRASVLVVDLDGRFNVNAHDGLMRFIYSGTNFTSGSNINWSSEPSYALDSVPLGSGYGPAEISGDKMFRASTLTPGPTFATSENPPLILLGGGGAERFQGRRVSGSRFSLFSSGDSPNSTPQLSTSEGRYGEKAPASWDNLPAAVTLGLREFRFARPGIPREDDGVSRINDQRTTTTLSGTDARIVYGIPEFWWRDNVTSTTGTSFNWGIPFVVSGTLHASPRSIFNSPPDLHGRMKTQTLGTTGTGFLPRVVLAKPEWSSTLADGGREGMDDPYELLLDTRLGRGGILFDPTTAGSGASTSSLARDNPFTPAELEPVLRPYDVDTNKMPPRLAAMLGSAAEESRLKVTTDSWDTTAITGSAAIVLFGTQGGTTGWLQRPAFHTLTLSGSTPLSGIIGGEVARGERFDLNRALLASGTATASYSLGNLYYRQRQAYFKDLYTLLFALRQGNGPAPSPAEAAQIAQWVANVIEFRDADSVMTPFEYDFNPSNGWDVDGDITTTADEPERGVVFGVERPEILITETLAWERVDSGTTGGMLISLHRPWNAIATGTGTVQIAAEPCDYALDTLLSGSTGRPTNVIDLGKKPHAGIMSSTNSLYGDRTNAAYPIWRLRIESNGGTQYVRFDTNTAGTNELIVSGTSTPGTPLQSGDAKPKLPVDTTYTFFSGTTADVGTGSVELTLSGSTRQALNSSEFRVAGGPAAVTTGTRTATVFLERLSNPGMPASAAVWTAAPLASSTTSGTNPQQYVVVDSATMTIFNTGTQVTNPSLNSTRRLLASSTTAPWRTSGTTVPVSGPYPTLTSSTTTAWMPWPNRPFVSSAELTLVPRGHALGMLENYQQLTPAVATGTVAPAIGIPVAADLLFDAVHVPTRFAGIHQTYMPDLSGTTGIFSTGSNAITTVNQLSSFREPGRVNINTVPSEDVWNAVVAGQLSTPVVSRTDSTIQTAPAQNMYATLSLASGVGSVIVTDTTSQLAVNRNPLHGIYTATRLANTITPRSNVFGVWITLREAIPNDPDSVKFHRAFYIVDRSIPVGFEEGKDHNVWDCVRLRRIIE